MIVIEKKSIIILVFLNLKQQKKTNAIGDVIDVRIYKMSTKHLNVYYYLTNKY